MSLLALDCAGLTLFCLYLVLVTVHLRVLCVNSSFSLVSSCGL